MVRVYNVGTIDIDAIARDVSDTATIKINGVDIDLNAADGSSITGDENRILTQAELIAEINRMTGTHNVTAVDKGRGTIELSAERGEGPPAIVLADGTGTPITSLGFNLT